MNKIRSLSIDTKKIFFWKNRKKIKMEIIKMSYEVSTEREAHLGPALPPADLVTALFFETMMRIDPLNLRLDLALVYTGYLLGSP